MKSSVNKIILGCFILFIGCIHFTTGTRACDANTRANYQSRMPPQLKQHLVNAEAEKIMPKCLMMQFKIACSECNKKRTDAEFDHCLLLQRSQSQQMADANPQLKQICMEETMAAVSEKMRNARQSNQFDEFNEDEYDQFDEFGATRTCDESAMRNFISTMTPTMRQKNAPFLRMAPKCSMMGFEIACSRCNTEDTDADFHRCLYSQEGKVSSPELFKTCHAERMAYQMKQHGRSLRSRRSLDAAPFFSGAIMGHQKNHGGRSLSRYYKGNFPKRPFSQRPYRGPWRGGTLADYHAWAAYQQTPTKAELRAEKRALKQAIKICSAHAQHIKSTAIANGPAATGWWEWSVNYENDPKFKGMKVIGGAYTNERPYCIANPHKGDMFITKQSYMIYKRDGPMVRAGDYSPDYNR